MTRNSKNLASKHRQKTHDRTKLPPVGMKFTACIRDLVDKKVKLKDIGFVLIPNEYVKKKKTIADIIKKCQSNFNEEERAEVERIILELCEKGKLRHSSNVFRSNKNWSHRRIDTKKISA